MLFFAARITPEKGSKDAEVLEFETALAGEGEFAGGGFGFGSSEKTPAIEHQPFIEPLTEFAYRERAVVRPRLKATGREGVEQASAVGVCGFAAAAGAAAAADLVAEAGTGSALQAERLGAEFVLADEIDQVHPCRLTRRVHPVGVGEFL